MVRYSRRGWLVVLGLWCFSGVGEAQTAEQAGSVGDKPQGIKPSDASAPGSPDPVAVVPPDPKGWTTRYGTAFFGGFSNVPGSRAYSDRFWISGAFTAHPSTVYLRGFDGQGQEARLSLGVGRNYNGSASTLNQPVEAWYARPVGKSKLKVGKFWVPFALEEWEAETKWGIQLSQQQGTIGLTGSLNFDSNQNALNGYFRANRDFGKALNVGLSLAAGKGINSGAVQDKGIGLDAVYTQSGWQIATENLIFTRNAGERFNFNFVQLSYLKMGRLKPFAGKFYWRDQTGRFGSFHSTSVGALYQLTPELALRGGVAATPGRTARWLELHVRIER